jgi:isopenicillin-N N-acyltransferase like protein
MALPILDLTGSPFERGQIHGRALADNIAANVSTYKNRFMLGGASLQRINDEAANWAHRLQGHDQQYFEEMQGIADGAAISIADIALLNARYELSYTLYTNEAAAANDIPSHEPEGCTAFGVQPEFTATGHTLMGQNWDWLEGLLGNLCILRVRSNDHPDYMTITQAGIVSGMIGINEHGVGLCVNGLSSHGDGAELHHRPFHMRVQDILRSTSLFDALKVVFETDRVCSTNWMIGQRGGEVLDIESSSKVAHTLYPADGLITHGNHFINRTGITSEFERIAPCSLYRTPRLDRIIRQNTQKWDVAHLKNCLKDTFGFPKGICRFPNPNDPEEARTVTVTSVILDLDALTMEVTDGPPDTAPFEMHQL